MVSYFSTRGHKDPLSFEDVILSGVAPDKGLYLPDSITLENLTYLTQEDLRRFLEPVLIDVLKKQHGLTDEQLRGSAELMAEIQSLRTSNSWGGELHLAAIAHAFQRPLWVFTANDSNKLKAYNPNIVKNPEPLCVYHNGGHFEPLEPIQYELSEESGAKMSLSK